MSKRDYDVVLLTVNTPFTQRRMQEAHTKQTYSTNIVFKPALRMRFKFASSFLHACFLT